MTACPEACIDSRRVMDRLEYSTIEGRRMVKVRVLCSQGHSAWLTMDLGAMVDERHVAARWKHEEEDGARAVEGELQRVRPAAQSGITTRAPQVVSASPPPPVKRRSGRRVWIWTPERLAELALMWNRGDKSHDISTAMRLSHNRSLTALVSEFRQSHPELKLVSRHQSARRSF